MLWAAEPKDHQGGNESRAQTLVIAVSQSAQGRSVHENLQTFRLWEWVILSASSMVGWSTSELYTCFLNIAAYSSICFFAQSMKPRSRRE